MAKKKHDVTPMMRQFYAAKEAAGDALLFFRMGDFYELFGDDAKTAARILGLALTSRDKGENATPMAGFPHRQLEPYIARVLKAGHRVAVCDQMEDPKEAQGIVKREITRIVSPGTITETELLEPKECNYLASIAAPSDAAGKNPDATPLFGLAWVELSTGSFTAGAFPEEALYDQLARIAPSEILVDETAAPLPSFLTEQMMVTQRPDWAYGLNNAKKTLGDQFGTLDLGGFGFANTDESEQDLQAIRAAGAILDYLNETQKTSLDHMDTITPYRVSMSLEIDEATRRGLEITRSQRDNSRAGSLLDVIDRTVSSMGGRLLAEWIAAPLVSAEAIRERLDAVEDFVNHPQVCNDFRELLKRVYDLERLTSRVATRRAGPRVLSHIGKTLLRLPQIKESLSQLSSPLVRKLVAEIDPCSDLCELLNGALVDECPAHVSDGDFIKDGFRKEFDELTQIASGGKEWIARYQAEQAELLGISNLKISYNKVFGYYLEATAAQKSKVPDHYERKQTLKNAERYSTPELKEYEVKVLSAEEKVHEMELDIFAELRTATEGARRRMRATATILGVADAIAALAALAVERNYAKPTIVDEPQLDIRDGRHPVLDILEPEGVFVPNDTLMETTGEKSNNIQLITGPNMAGKSTYIRQVALIALMAQMGSFVPATSATIGPADRIFARIGASDQLSRGRSTFLVEMVETARILNTATPQSLIILDEIGRGTSTYDGLSLAWAVVEYLDANVKARTLFATHYHELTELEKSLPSVKNLNVAVREWQDDLMFLHKIVEGAADKSYGIHVARLAGTPKLVIERAKDILAALEDEHLDASGRAKFAKNSDATAESNSNDIQLTFFGNNDPLLDEIREVDLDATTPREALALIERWQQKMD